MHTLWPERFAQRTQGMRRSEIRELLKLTEQPGVISFGGGLPAPEVFPAEAFRDACDRVLRTQAAEALQYGATEGYRPLREMIARHSARYGVTVTADNILITSGSQQALDLIGKVFINQGDHILVERPTYLAAIQAWNTYQAQYTPVDMDGDGMRPDQLEAALRGAPKFIYALPNFQNPTGVTLSLERRQALVSLADHYGCPVIEDDPYGQLRYEGEHLPSIVAVDSEYRSSNGNPYSGNVMYMSTFSKTLAPGLRLGWIIGPASVIERLIQAKQGTDLHTSTFNQVVAYEVARHGFLDDHVRLIRRVYRERRDAMLAAMTEFFPEETTWTHPEGGLFLWVRFPAGIDAVDLLRESLNEKVAFLAGAPFFVDRPEANTGRFNFSYVDPERIRDGVKRIAKVLKQMLKGATVQATRVRVAAGLQAGGQRQPHG